MEKHETVQKIIKKAGGIAKTADFVSEGLSNYDVARLCRGGYLARVRHGYYHLAEQADLKEEQVLASLLPEGVVCVESALFYYGYSKVPPEQWTIAVPRTFSRTKLKIDSLPVKAYFVQAATFQIGKTNGTFNGVPLAVYDRERTICDCFKYRTKLDNGLFNMALNAYVADEKKNLQNLSSYASELHVYKKLMDIMTVLLNR